MRRSDSQIIHYMRAQPDLHRKASTSQPSDTIKEDVVVETGAESTTTIIPEEGPRAEDLRSEENIGAKTDGQN